MTNRTTGLVTKKVVFSLFYANFMNLNGFLYPISSDEMEKIAFCSNGAAAAYVK
jgi:hypothetical protein